MKRWEFERALLASDLAAPARLILLALAVLADWPGGVVPIRFSPSLTTLAELTGLSRRTVAEHLNQIERSDEREGWVVRGRPTKENARSKKERTRYRLTVPASAPRAPELVQEAHQASASDALASAGGAPELVQEAHRASAPGAHSPDLSRPSQTAAKPRPQTSTPEQIVTEYTGATPEEAAAVARRVANERNPRSLAGLLRRMGTDGDLTQLLTEQRATAIRASVSDALAVARRGPACEHGEAGGAALHPTSGEPLCPGCRMKARRSALKVVPA